MKSIADLFKKFSTNQKKKVEKYKEDKLKKSFSDVSKKAKKVLVDWIAYEKEMREFSDCFLFRSINPSKDPNKENAVYEELYKKGFLHRDEFGDYSLKMKSYSLESFILRNQSWFSNFELNHEY